MEPTDTEELNGQATEAEAEAPEAGLPEPEPAEDIDPDRAQELADEATLELVVEGALKDEGTGQEQAAQPEAEEAETAEEAGKGEAQAEQTEASEEGKAQAEASAEEPQQQTEQAQEAEDEEDDEAFIASLSERAQKRFQALTERVRQAEEQLQGWRETLQATGARPEELSALLEYSRLIHSSRPEDQRRALQILEQERQALARRLGEPVPGVDLLAEHPDLKAKVEASEMGLEDALEVARARALRAQAEQQARSQEQLLAAQQAEQQAIAELNALGAQLAAQDPDYQRKIEILQQEQLPWIRQHLPPQQWAAAVQVAYRQLSQALEAAARQQARPAPERQPLRTAPSAGGGRQVPRTLQQAVELAVAQASGGQG